MNSVVEKNEGKPKISWLLCTNAIDENLHLAIASCLNQTYSDFELIIVINGKSRDYIEKRVIESGVDLSKVRIFKTEIMLLPFSLNLGIHFARGEFIARIDADDVAYPTRLQAQWDAVTSHPDIDLVTSDVNIIDANGAKVGLRPGIRSSEEFARHLIFRNPIVHPSIMIRRKLLLSIGGYPSNPHAEDYGMLLIANSVNQVKVVSAQGVLTGYRLNPEGASRRAREAYTSVSGQMLDFFLRGYGFRYLFGSMVQALKSFTRSR